jgi:phage major head subunit gpT-like protein
MAITPASFNLFISTVNTLIGEVYTDATLPELWKNFASVIPSSGSQNVYGWTGMLPKMRLWKGSRVVVQANPQTYTLVNMPFEHTLSIDRFHLDDDLFGIYYRQIPDQARQVRREPDYASRDLLEALGDFSSSVQQSGLDGLTAFSTAHPVNIYAPALGTYVNDFLGGGVTVSGRLIGGAFSPTALATVVEYQMTLPGEDGEPLGIMPGLIMVPAALKLEAELVIKSMFFAPPAWGTITGQVGAADNPLRRFGVDPLVNPYLKSLTRWYSMDVSKSFKPLIYQIREAPVYTPRVNEQDPTVFDLHRYLWGVWSRFAIGWSYSFLFARSGP